MRVLVIDMRDYLAWWYLTTTCVCIFMAQQVTKRVPRTDPLRFRHVMMFLCLGIASAIIGLVITL